MCFIQKPLLYHILIASTFILLLISSCGKQGDHPAKNENPDFQHALWITDAREWPVADSLMFGEFPAPLFRKEFIAKRNIRSAKLFVTAAGYYRATINGESIGKNYLDPAWTDYGKRIYYTEYDITSRLKEINCIGITLGNGFYNPLPLQMWSRFNLRKVLPVGKPVFIVKLRIEYDNGDKEEVITDRSWKYSYGPVLKNSVYLGEVYDGGKEIMGWDSAGYDDSSWKSCIENDGPGGRLEKAFFPPVLVTGLQKPVAVLTPVKGTCIFDMGVNFTGLYRVRLKGKPGDTVVFRFAERLYDNGELNPMTTVCGQIKKKGMGGAGSPDVAWQTDRYIFGNKTEVWYSPSFSFHIYRYMEITGLGYKPDLTDLEGLPFHTHVENNNSFTCSSALINSIQEASTRTFLNNLISVQSDCPAREKFGYGGDLNATCESFIFNFNMQSFYRKTIYDWIDAMQDSIFIDEVPFVGIKYCGISWESAFLITQYQLFLYYNDTALIKELYDLDLKWMEKVHRLIPSGIASKGLADHESLVRVPVKLIGTTHYLACARVMKKFASLMNDRKNEEKFDRLARDISASILDIYWRKHVMDTINPQTRFATLLYYDILPEQEKQACLDSLFTSVRQAPAHHFTTGIFGTQYVLEALSTSGNTGQVYNIVNSDDFPGWGYMISRGATTIWETWKESDNIYSNCHPMFGSVSGWFYRWLAGIRPDPDNPGFRKFLISPFLPEGLTFVKCSYQSPFGLIKSNWERSGMGAKFDVTVPHSSNATFRIPVSRNSTVVVENLTKGTTIREKASGTIFETELGEGSYNIRY
jgi:alpha-L-rhamnosidase